MFAGVSRQVDHPRVRARILFRVHPFVVGCVDTDVTLTLTMNGKLTRV